MNGKQLKQRDQTIQQASLSPTYADVRRHRVAKGVGLFLVAFALVLTTSGYSGRLIGSSEPLIDSHPGQFAVYFFAGFAGICGLDLIRRS
ncbi:hypothetical protein [Leptothoe sp. PORK10 BA2]|uniref:hypothetical protein n=1 Tax=Leptothoe sp. PORK10 BA2 TaxID=3110254 RepID=UPI002B1EA304|nr:hypothetical protein [Leptothoe sp. PORK10 BA2]MEA5464551.1 hypothetical protein [Leptothoe sp. PORK10 BA2]